MFFASFFVFLPEKGGNGEKQRHAPEFFNGRSMPGKPAAAGAGAAGEMVR
jgi:hypothetical protein